MSQNCFFRIHYKEFCGDYFETRHQIQMLDQPFFGKVFCAYKTLNSKMGYLNVKISCPNEKFLPLDTNSFLFKLLCMEKHFRKNWLISHLYFMSSSEIFFRKWNIGRKIQINRHPVILKPNIRKKFQLFFGNRIKILNNVFARKDSTITFSAFFEWF
jgi:hypothetical protein